MHSESYYKQLKLTTDKIHRKSITFKKTAEMYSKNHCNPKQNKHSRRSKRNLAETIRRNTKSKRPKNHNSKMVQTLNRNAQTHKRCRKQ